MSPEILVNEYYVCPCYSTLMCGGVAMKGSLQREPFYFFVMCNTIDVATLCMFYAFTS